MPEKEGNRTYEHSEMLQHQDSALRDKEITSSNFINQSIKDHYKTNKDMSPAVTGMEQAKKKLTACCAAAAQELFCGTFQKLSNSKFARECEEFLGTLLKQYESFCWQIGKKSNEYSNNFSDSYVKIGYSWLALNTRKESERTSSADARVLDKGNSHFTNETAAGLIPKKTSDGTSGHVSKSSDVKNLTGVHPSYTGKLARSSEKSKTTDDFTSLLANRSVEGDISIFPKSSDDVENLFLFAKRDAPLTGTIREWECEILNRVFAIIHEAIEKWGHEISKSMFASVGEMSKKWTDEIEKCLTAYIPKLVAMWEHELLKHMVASVAMTDRKWEPEFVECMVAMMTVKIKSWEPEFIKCARASIDKITTLYGPEIIKLMFCLLVSKVVIRKTTDSDTLVEHTLSQAEVESNKGIISDPTPKPCMDVQDKETTAETNSDNAPILCTEVHSTTGTDATLNPIDAEDLSPAQCKKTEEKLDLEVKEEQKQDGIIDVSKMELSMTGPIPSSEVPQKLSSDGIKSAANPNLCDDLKNPVFAQPTERERISALIAENMRKKATKSETIGKEGGEISLYGCSVLFPKDAVKDDTTFCLEVDNNLENFPPDVISITPVMGLVPHMDFEEDVTVIMRTCYSATDDGEIPGEIWSQEEDGEWELAQTTLLKFKNQLRFKVRHFSGKVAAVQPEDSETGECHLLNHVFIQQGTAAVISVFCQDEKSLQDCEIGLSKAKYVNLSPLYEEISCTLDSTFIIEVQCEEPKIKYKSSPGPAQFKFTKYERRKRHISLLFTAEKRPKKNCRDIRLLHSITIKGENNNNVMGDEDRRVPSILPHPWPIELTSQGPIFQNYNSVQSGTTGNLVAAPGANVNLTTDRTNFHASTSGQNYPGTNDRNEPDARA